MGFPLSGLEANILALLHNKPLPTSNPLYPWAAKKSDVSVPLHLEQTQVLQNAHLPIQSPCPDVEASWQLRDKETVYRQSKMP